MKYQNEYGRQNRTKKPSIGTVSHAAKKRRKKFKQPVVFNRKHKKYRLVSVKINPNELVIYAVLNTDVNTGLGAAIIMIIYSILELCDKLAADRIKNIYIDQWKRSGKNMLFLRGYNHKHLKHIEREAKFVSLESQAIYYGDVMMALSVFGRKEEIEDIFDGLRYIR